MSWSGKNNSKISSQPSGGGNTNSYLNPNITIY